VTNMNIFRGELLLAEAQRHLSNRASRMIDGRLHCDGAPREAIDLMTELMRQLNNEKRINALRRKKRRAA
jgi:hypothetical protein